MNKQIRLLMVDDHPIVLWGIKAQLLRHQQIKIVGEAANGCEAIRLAQELQPDIVLMDIDMPEMDGLTATEVLHGKFPRIKVLFLSIHSNPNFVLRMIKSGAHGFVSKGASADELVRAIKTVSSGQNYFSTSVAQGVLSRLVQSNGSESAIPKLTNRECEVLKHIAEGMSNKEISRQLNIGVRTVETHRERIMRKLYIHNVAGLTRYALEQGLVALMPSS